MRLKQCVIIGKTNVGKTLFAINFASFLGISKLEMEFTTPGGEVHERTLLQAAAVAELTSDAPHHTLGLQRIHVKMPGFKGQKQFALVDTSGLAEGIHEESLVRKAMAQTLAQVRNAQVILHLVDASSVGKVGTIRAMGEVDWQVAQFGGMRQGYAILANKMDVEGAHQGLVQIRQDFPGHLIIPISALQKTGFAEVKQFVWRHL